MKGDVAEFQTDGYVSKITLSYEGLSQANKLFGKKILKNKKEDYLT